MLLLIGLTSDPQLIDAFQRLESLSLSIFETRQASRSRLLHLLAEEEQTRREIESRLRSSLVHTLRVEREQYHMLEDGWNTGATAPRLDAGFYRAPQGRIVLRQVQRILQGTLVAREVDDMIAKLEQMSDDAWVVFWATSEDLMKAY